MSAVPRRSASSRKLGATMTQAARESASCCRYRGLERKEMLEASAASSGAIRRMRVSPEPRSSPPRAAAISPSVTSITEGPHCRRSSLRRGVQRTDHLVGDIDARPGEHGFLKDQVVFLLLEDLLDDLVGAIDDGSQLLVLALIQVFLEFAALALELAILIHQLALTASALAFGKRRSIFLEPIGSGLQPRSGIGQLLLALGELGLELCLGRLRRSRVAQYTLAVHVADLQFLGLRRGNAHRQQAGSEHRHQGKSLHQNAVPIWNWNFWILSC